MVSDQDYERLTIIQDIFRPGVVKTFVLAESGVTTGFNIVDVEIKDNVSPSFRTRNTLTTEMNLTITEPYGMTIVDKMFQASQRLGIRNWRFAPLILTLEIRGYTENGVAIRSSPIKKAWKILILDFDSTLNESGSVYKITAAAHNALAFRDQFYMLPTNLVIKVNSNGTPTALGATTAPAPTPQPAAPAAPGPPANPNQTATSGEGVASSPASNSGAGQPNQSPPSPTGSATPSPAPEAPTGAQPPVNQATPNSQTPQTSNTPNSTTTSNIDGSVGQFFTTLGEIITKFYRDARGDPAATRTTPLMVYEFQVAPKLASQMIEITSTTNARRIRFSPGSHNQEIHVNRVGISELVDDIVSSLQDSRWLLVDENSGRIRVPRVESRIEYIGWDGILNNYVQKITFYITVMETLRAIPDPDYGDRFQSSPQNQLVRLQNMAQQGLHKLYPYIYSGYNTEIISFDIKFNHLHIIPMPLYGGATITPAADGQSELRRLQAERRDIQTALNLTNEQIAENQRRLEATNAQLLQEALSGVTGDNANASTSTALQSQISTLRTNQAFNEADRIRVDQDISYERTRNVVIFDPALAGRYNLPSSSESAQLRQRAIAQQQALNQRQPRNFIEDLNINQRDPGALSYAGDPRDLNNTYNRSPTTADPRQNETRGLYSTILAQLYDRAGMQLTEVELEIRGDPYWFGITNMERIFELDSYVKGNSPGAVPDTYESSNTTDRNRQFANYYGRDAQFLLLFRAGQQPSETTGFMDFTRGSQQNQSVFFNGVYNAIEVTHIFSEGKFTQRLLGIRDPLVNVNNLPANSPGTSAVSQGAANPSNNSAGAPAGAQASASAAGTSNPTQPQQATAAATSASSASTNSSTSGAPISANSRQAQINADNATILAQTKNEEFVGGRGRAPQLGGSNLTGEGRGINLLGEGGTSDPSALRPGDQLTVREAEIRIGGVSPAEIERVRQENLARRGSGR